MKILKYIFSGCALFFFSQCTDLNEEPYTFLSPANYYKNADELNTALVGVYDGYQNGFNGYYKYIMYLEVLTEFGSPAYAKDDAQLWNVWSDMNNSDKMVITNWDDAYNIINRANLVLGRGAAVEMDENLKKRYFAEARFLRAATYYNLVRMYGGVPIPETFTEGLKNLAIARKTTDETYAYIIADLEYAEENLPVKSDYKNGNVWRASKGAAQALLGDLYLTRGGMTGDRSYFQKSKDYCGKVIQSSQYNLQPNFKDLWFWWNTNNKNGMESVFELQYGSVENEYNNNHVMFGVNITETTLGCYMYHRFGPSIQHYLSYSNDDTRKEGSFLTRVNVTEKGNPSKIIQTIEFVPEDKGFFPGSKGWKTASPGNLKFYDRTESSASLKKPQTNSYAIRYADVLLDYAEAENEINGPAAAYTYINRVRNRANLPDLTPGLGKEDFADAIYRERGWEFVGEGVLFFDELRTNRIGKNVANHVKWGNDNKINMYVNNPLQFIPSKNFLFKIPRYDLDSNPALIQNPDNTSN